jgi:putative phosphotransacetylase
VGPEGELTLDTGVIIAERHVHMSPADAKWFGVVDGQQVKMAVAGPKAGIMERVTVRVSEAYRLDFHIDTDDGNAFLLRQGERVRLIK